MLPECNHASLSLHIPLSRLVHNLAILHDYNILSNSRLPAHMPSDRTENESVLPDEDGAVVFTFYLHETAREACLHSSEVTRTAAKMICSKTLECVTWNFEKTSCVMLV
jgi:hypothetical protein